MNTNLSLFHTLETDIITFKPLNIEDAAKIHEYASDEEVSRFIGWKLMKSLEETREFVETMIKREEAGTHMYASVVLKAAQAVIGTVMLFDFDREANQAEVGYVFHKSYWGRGYGTKSIALLTDFAFDTLKLHKLHASVVDANIGSARILEKNGYVLEGRLQDHFFIEDNYYDSLLYGKIKSK
ncbi:GNAT family N-acetyltransferase [Anaerocolumna sp. AGMB13025]|uniref:GNAT family N-acetyltransferase n=1 Tax=Anaerocolumna sp. AGMB13025 TaxID=3039116 RepID=UPI00241E1F03|nr:GNAT family N-acetyltransferase [Anaerocolumna sp. AGMB13025]WFR55619.1 GNAT family N-acetyltransferase [Anaerocolumna sp. AGMB13025]